MANITVNPEDLYNEFAGFLNDKLAHYVIVGILATLIGVGLFLLLLTYLPYIVGLLVVALLVYLAYHYLVK